MAIVGAVAPLIGGIAGMAQSNYQAKVAQMNADIAKENADRASTKSEIDAQESDFQTKALLGEQEVAQAGSGVTLSGKSQILTRRAASAVGAGDRMKLLQGGQVERYNFLTQRANFKAEAQASKLSGMFSLVGGAAAAIGNVASMGSGASLSSSATQTASPYKYIPQPIAKPASLPINSPINPLLKQYIKYPGGRMVY